MEQGQWNLVLGKQGGELFLGAVLGPGGAEKAGILGGVGIADHHFLAPGHSLPIERHRQQGRHGVLGVVQVIQSLKQRYHTHGLADPGDFLQQHHRQHIRRGPGHGDHIGAQPFTALLGNHPAGGQHFCHLVAAFLTAVKTVINQRATGLQLLNQESLLALLRPVRVAAQLQIAGHRIHRITMTGGFLANIQTEQGNTEAVEPAQGVFQVAVGDIAQPDCTQGAVDQLQGSQQLFALQEALTFRHRQVFYPRFHLSAGQLQPLPHLAQNHAIGLVARAGFAQQFLAGRFHGQVCQQVFHIAQVQVCGHPAGQQQHFPGYRRGHIGITVPVTPHPRGQLHRRPVRRRLRQVLLRQLPLQLPHHFRDRLPQGLLNGGETPFGLVHWGGPFTANLIGAPGGEDQAVKLLATKGQLVIGQIRPVQLTEQVRHLVVFADQGSAGHFSRVGSEHQLHGQVLQSAVDHISAYLLLLQTLQHIGETLITTGIPGVTLVLTVQAFTVMLFGNVAQIEKLAEGPGHFQQGGVIQGGEQIAQGRQCCTLLATGSDRGFADGFDGLVEIVTGLLTQTLAQQVPQ